MLQKASKTILLVLIAMLLGLGALLSWNCGSGPQEIADEGPAAGPSGVEMVQIGPDYPKIFIDAYLFQGRMQLSETFPLDRSYDLEFFPLLLESGPAGSALETVLVDGDQEISLGSHEAFLTQSSAAKSRSGRFEALTRRVRFDLSPYQGREVTFKWIVREAGSARPLNLKGAVGNLRLQPRTPVEPKKPHILFICSDAHRFDYSISDQGPALMPRLQQLRRDAVTYQRAYSNASWTLPSVVSTLTGVFPRFHRTGMRVKSGTLEELKQEFLQPGEFLLDWGDSSHILTAYPKQLNTLTEYLRPAGYRTAMVLSNPLYMLSGLFEDGQDVVIDTTVVPGKRVNEAAFQIMDTMPAEQPLFLLVHYMDVHHHTQFYFNKKYPGKKPREAREEWIATYAEASRDTDRYLGELLDKWNGRFGLDQTLVVFYADHGEHLLDQGRYVIGHGNTMDELLMHVPLVIQYPRSAGIGPAEVDVPISLTDLVATALDVADVDFKDEFHETHSALALLKGASNGPRTIHADYQLYHDDLSSVRQGALKLVLNLTENTRRMVDTTLPRGKRGEFDQVVKNHPRQAEFEAAFEAYVKEAEEKAAYIESDFLVDPDEALEGLENLGYVGGGKTHEKPEDVTPEEKK